MNCTSPTATTILSGSPFMSGPIILISALFFTVGFACGKAAGTIKDLTQAINMVVKTFAGMAGLTFLLLVIARFIAFFSYTGIATVLAGNLADFLIGTIVSLMLPYTVVLMILWTLLLIA